MTRKIIGCLFVCFLPFLLCGAVNLDEDTIEGVVVALREKHPAAEASDEINGIVIAEPCPIAPSVCQVRVCTNKEEFINVVSNCDAEKLKQSGCQPGCQISCSGNQTFPGYMSCPQAKIQTKPGCGEPMYTLSQAVNSGVISYVGLRGDGANTMECQMPCTNALSQDIKVCVPRGQCFAPNNPECQNMACTQDVICSIPAGQTVKVPLTTMCMSGKTLKPPPPSGVHFNLAPHDPEEAKLTDRLLTATNILNADHFYDELPPGEERPKTIAQMSHWIQKGMVSGNPADVVSAQSIRDDMLSKTNLTYSSLSSSDKKTIDKMCAQIFKASKCTLKLAQSPQMDSLIAGK